MPSFSRRRATAVLAAAALCALVPAAVADGRGLSTGIDHAAAAPATCGGPQVRKLVLAFVAAFNGGSNAKLAAQWTTLGFRWYSVTRTPKQRYETFNRGKMLRYFAARHGKSETLALKTFRFNGADGDYRHFRFTVTRSAKDVARGTRETYVGTGAAVCLPAGSRLAEWSMGRPAPEKK